MPVSARTLLRNALPLAVFLLALACHPAFAGHWSYTDYNVTDGVIDFFQDGENVEEESWGTETNPAYDEFFSYTPGYIGQDKEMKDHAVLHGIVTWIHDDPDHPENDPAPQHQFIRETSSTLLNAVRDGGGSGNVSGSVNNGLGDPGSPLQTDNSDGLETTTSTSIGTHLQRVDSSSGVITTDCAVSMSGKLTSPVGDWDVQNIVSDYSVEVVSPPAAMITSSIDTSYHNAADGTRQPNLPSEDGSVTNGDSAATWDAFYNQWVGHASFQMNDFGFNNPVPHWTPGGNLLVPCLTSDPNEINCTFGLGASTSGSLSSTTTTCNVADSDGTNATKTYNIQWHLPEEANGGPYDIEAGKYNIGGPRGGPVADSETLLVSDTPAHEEQWSAKLDGAEVIAGAFGQEDLVGAIKVVGAIATLSEWQTDVPDEPASQSGGTNGPTTWHDAITDDHEIYGGGNILPAEIESDPYGYELCNMYRFQVAHYMDKYWHAFGYDAHGYDGNPNHVIYARKIDSVYDEWQFIKFRNRDGTTYTP